MFEDIQLLHERAGGLAASHPSLPRRSHRASMEAGKMRCGKRPGVMGCYLFLFGEGEVEGGMIDHLGCG